MASRYRSSSRPYHGRNDSSRKGPTIPAEMDRLLQFWRALELFTPHLAPAENDDEDLRAAWAQAPGTTARGKLTVEYPSGRRRQASAQSLPWEWARDAPAPAETANRKLKKPKYTVFFGVHRQQFAVDSLLACFPTADEDQEARAANAQGGFTVVAAVVVDGRGRIVEKSASLSSGAWCVGHAHTTRARSTQAPALSFGTWPDHVARATAEFTQAIAEDYGASNNAPELEMDDLWALQEAALQAAQLDGLAAEAPQEFSIRITCEDVAQDTDLGRPALLSSFYLGSLSQARQATFWYACGACAPQARFLSTALPEVAAANPHRVDVLAPEGAAALRAAIAPKHLPPGRWPANPQHSLSSSQTFALVQALQLARVPEKGPYDQLPIFGVNGPPGTGKTTVLKDVVANIIVQRAEILAHLERPMDALVVDPAGSTPVHLREDLEGWGILIASANNGAVDNVVTDATKYGALDEEFWDDVDYYAELARPRRSTTTTADSTGTATRAGRTRETAWGILGGRLGNSSNRRAFAARFFPDSGSRTAADFGFLAAADVPSWAEAKSEFLAARRAVDELLSHAQQAADEMATHAKALQQHEHASQQARAALADYQATVSGCLTAGAAGSAGAAGTVPPAGAAGATGTASTDRTPLSAEELLARVRQCEQQAAAALAAEEARPRGFLQRILALFRGSARNDAARQQLSTQRDAWRATAAQLEGLAQAHVQAWAALQQARSECASVEARLRGEFGAHADNPTDISPEATARREKFLPWATPALERARTRVFLAALRLHQAWLKDEAVRTAIAGELAHATQLMIDSSTSDRARSNHALQLLFMLVPMVSSTFASIGSCFSFVNDRQIGWLIIDEAGQASPQQAIGAFRVARRALVVGDPLQLPPVVVTPQAVVREMMAELDIPERFDPRVASVQSLVDLLSRYGTTLGGATWVSAPLRAHRRCQEPMFSLCNDMAYEGMMIHATPPMDTDSSAPEAAGEEALPRSCWVDVPAEATTGHVQPKELAVLEQILNDIGTRALSAHDGAAAAGRAEQRRVLARTFGSVFALSPFRAVADRLEELAETYPMLKSGSVHTAQGREADTVILVLGGAAGADGARAWASDPVNLVNVAVSRARRRLIIIGDYAAWHKPQFAPFFTLGNALPHIDARTLPQVDLPEALRDDNDAATESPAPAASAQA
ncbi:hypothetical protein C1Y63_09050 [Corynebacterium sp. 13CS0277]|uniref:DEAD/DEAH box helicase n=1 Tax=Corynebacterium sp. 13CS0277 TaxID=2071994 RepID=UPI000D0468FC|nr:ATP-binding protein [Corynebacterium sp. 13CS0277]PRQ10880.1 hypothetical protein C1Y63_09050 [Corynebacterium sp. 13CS0277]